MDAIKGLLKIYVADIQLSLPLSALFNDVEQIEDLVCTSSSLPKTCLLLSKLEVHCFRDPPDDGLSYDLTGDRQRGDSSPVVAIYSWLLSAAPSRWHPPSSYQVVVSPPIFLQRVAKELVLQTLDSALIEEFCIDAVLFWGSFVFEGSDGCHYFLFSLVVRC